MMEAERPAEDAAFEAQARGPSPGSLKELVVQDVIQGLYEGRYRPGQRLVEAELTAKYGTSRGTIREALNRLTAMGIVELFGQRGAEIGSLSLADAVDTLVISEGLITIAARFAAGRIAEADHRERLQAALARVAATDPAVQSGAARLSRDRFYSTLTRISQVADLDRVFVSLRTHIVRVQYRELLLPVDQYRHYQRIAEAIFAGDARAAERAVRAHMRLAIAALTATRDRMLRRRG